MKLSWACRSGGAVAATVAGLVMAAACPGAPKRMPPPNGGVSPGEGGSGGGLTTGGSGGGGGGRGGGGGGAMAGSGGGAAGAGGQGAGGAGGASSGQVELKMTWWGSPDRHTRTIAVINMFMAKNPNIKITYQHFMSTNTEYWPMMKSMAEAKSLPDIMQQDHAYLAEWTDAKQLLPLDALVRDGSLDLRDVPANLVDGGKVKDQLMGVNLGSNTQAFVIDTDLFMRAGVAVPADTWTWDDFERAALEIKARLNIWGFGVGLHGYTPGWKAVYLSAGAWVFTGDNTRIGYTNDLPWVTHWKMILRLQAAGAIPTRAQEMADYPTSDVEKYPIVAGRSAMEQIHSNQLVAMGNAAGMNRKFKLLPIPRIAGRGPSVYVKPSQYWSITAGTKYPREAAKFIDFFTNDLAANEALLAERGVPVAGKVLTALKPKLTSLQNEAFDLLARVTPTARPLPLPDPPAWSLILNNLYIPRVTDAVMAMTVSPEAATLRFRDEANALLSGGAPPDGGAPPPDGPPDAPGPRRALFVVGQMPLIGNDVPVHARLSAKMMTEIAIDTTTSAASAFGKSLVVISATSTLVGVGTKFRDVTVPVLLLEPNLYGPMDFTGSAGRTDADTILNQTQIAIITPAHPLAAGFPAGNVTVYSMPYKIVWGLPGPGAQNVATVVGMAAQKTIFGYAAGAMMANNRPAPAKRVGFFIHDSTVNTVHPENGVRLLDAAIDWTVAP
jgi:multiple sugar transport system substrate-binding protein